MKVSFDFDGTLSKPMVQKYAKELLERGYDVRVTTARYDEHNKHKWKLHPSNEELYKVVDILGIRREKIVFMNMELKADYFKNHGDFIFHLDDDWVENNHINSETKIPSIAAFGNPTWKEECEAAIDKYMKETRKKIEPINLI